MKEILGYKLDRREFFERALAASLAGIQPVGTMSAASASTPAASSALAREEQSIAQQDGGPSDLTLSSNTVRIRFHRGRPHFGVFPKGYVGYTLDLRDGNSWVPMATAAYFSAYVYRSPGWGRDFLAYVIPQEVQLKKEGDAFSAVFSSQQTDLDNVEWHFTFTFCLRPREAAVEVTYSVGVNHRRQLLLFWGPRVYVGQGSFGEEKDEALFPGLEYLGPGQQSSHMSALAPDAQLHFVPDPVQITIPLMTVVNKGKMVGLMWDPLQKWNGVDVAPSALFVSPNWLEEKPNHLLGIFLPCVPKYVPENSLRAESPVTIEAGQEFSLKCRMFASRATHAVDAVALYLKTNGGLPPLTPKPRDYQSELEMLVRALTTADWDSRKKGWPPLYVPKNDFPEGKTVIRADPSTVISLRSAAPLLRDRELTERTQGIVNEALGVLGDQPIPLSLALRIGGVEKVLEVERSVAVKRIRNQQQDGSWVYMPGVVGEEGLEALKAPPQPGMVGYAGSRDEGLTAGEVAPLLEYALVSADSEALRAALKGIHDLDRYAIPFGYSMDMGEECPHAPSLHGAYLGLRSYLLAYRITGRRKYLERAVYWAKAGLVFIYLWSLPPQDVKRGHIAMHTYLRGDQLYQYTIRAPMLYGAMYGYGSSQFVFPWYGYVVQWIGLVYAQDLLGLATHDQTLPWKQIVNGILVSAMWLSYDRPPYTGYYPDAFNLKTWMPSGPAITPGALLKNLLSFHYGKYEGPQTVVLREGRSRRHLTSAAAIGELGAKDGLISFTLDDPDWSHCRAILAGIQGEPAVAADGKPLPRVSDLEDQEECWSISTRGQWLIKVKQTGQPRRIVVRHMSSPLNS